MSAPRWARRLLALLARPGREEEVVGDLEEAHRRRVERRGRAAALVLTFLETLDVAVSLLRVRVSAARFSWLDVKLGFRMLVKHPGLTVLGGLSIAFAIFVGAVAFEVVSQTLSPRIPLPGGDRIVALRLWDAAESRVRRRALFDAGIWRDGLRTVEAVTVYRGRERNLVTDDGLGAPVRVAEMEAAGFDLASTPPLLGRVLTRDDERPGSPPVAVIGHGLWTGRFARDPEIVGREVRLGGTPTTVVGVMPEGFGFPVAHELWTPFRAGAAAHAPGTGPPVVVLGRLADDASLEDARRELSIVGRRVATAHPATHEHLRPRVLPWSRAALGIPAGASGALLSVVGITSNLPLFFFLILVCGNVALLMFARATSRDEELAVRSALGASRGRIVAQLFAEALVLAVAAAAVGLAAAGHGLRWSLGIIREELFGGAPLPFWIEAGVSLDTVAYAVLLAVVGALVAGAWPGLRVTRSLGEGLRGGTPGGGGFRFGGVWTAVIAVQIVLTMVFPVLTYAVREGGSVELDYAPPFRPEEYMVARARADAGAEASGDRPGATAAGSLALRLEERLLAEPGVADVTVAERPPMTYHPWHQVEIDGPSATPRDERGHRVGSARVALDYFDVLGAEIVAGRGFHSADLEEGARAVVVDDAFVDRVLGGRNAVGVRLRYLANEAHRDPTRDPGPWLRIVGVVEEIGARSFYGPGGVYHPVRPGALAGPHLLVHLPGGTEGFAGRIRTLGVAVDPSLRLEEVESVVAATRGPRDFYRFWTTVLVAVSAFALLLSLGGIYAVMSYTVAQRTREIGIRLALGSSRLRVVASVFRRPLRQVALGIASGFAVLALLLSGADAGTGLPGLLLGLAVYTLVVTAVCLTACAAPTLRALGVEPAEALRVDA